MSMKFIYLFIYLFKLFKHISPLPLIESPHTLYELLGTLE